MSSTEQEIKELFAQIAIAAMQAHTQAAWAYPGPPGKAYEEWAKDSPPGSKKPNFQDWISDMAVTQAASMLARITPVLNPKVEQPSPSTNAP